MASPASTVSLVPRGRRFYLGMASVMLVLVFVGFARTFYLRPLFGITTPHVPIAYVHGGLMTAWYALFVAQALLAASGRTALHRRVGGYAAPVGVLALVSTAVATWQLFPFAAVAESHLMNQLTARQASGLFWGNAGACISFGVFLTAGLAYRRQPAIHKRLMLFAFISTVAPALARIPNWPVFANAGFNTSLNTPLIVLLVSALVVHDVLTRRRVHPVTLAGALFLTAMRVAFIYIVPGSTFGLSVAQTLRTAGTP